jgi:Uma2 family endonuclease
MSTVTHLTIAEYDRMIAAGVFEPREQNRLELIYGELREMTPIGSEHEVILDYLTEWSFSQLPKRKVWVRVQNSIGIPALDSAPEPDLAWVARRDYRRGRPTADDVLLVIEVSESTLRFDLGRKAKLYAAAGISDYWVVDVANHSIVVHRDPAGGGYREVRTYRESDELYPLHVPEVKLCPARLWRAADE